MQLECVAEVNATDKLKVLEDWRKYIGLSWKEVAYLGQFLFSFFLFFLVVKFHVAYTCKLRSTAYLQNHFAHC